MPAPNPPLTQSHNAQNPPDSKQSPDLELDITGYLCPMTFVRTRLALDRLRPGQLLAVRLKGEEPRTNIPKTAVEQGHEVLATTTHPDGTTTLLIRKFVTQT